MLQRTPFCCNDTVRDAREKCKADAKEVKGRTAPIFVTHGERPHSLETIRRHPS